MEITENKEIKDHRSKLLERLGAKTPDAEFADDDALFQRINDDYDDYDSQLEGYKSDADALYGMFAADPESARFLTEWKQGKNPVISFVERFGKDALEDPSQMEKIAEANKAYLDKVAKEKDLEDTYNKNMQQTLEDSDAFQEENGLTDEQMDELFVFLAKVVGDGILGVFSKETMAMGLKALNHDTDVAEAAHVGEVKGRNTKINNMVRKKQQGDGLARLDGKNNTPSQRSRRNNIFDLASDAM